MKDIGVTVQSNLKFTRHCIDIVKKAYFVLRNIFNTFKHHDTEFYVKLYKTYVVHPILEYACQVWSPFLKLNIDHVESAHRYFTRRVLYRENLDYLNRIEYLGVGTLEQRRIKADLVLYFKLVSDVTEIHLFRNANSQRGHNSQLTTLYSHTEKKKLFWSNRLVRNWNCVCESMCNIPYLKNY